MRRVPLAALMAAAALLPTACGDEPSVEEGGVPVVQPGTVEDVQRGPGSAAVIAAIERAAETRNADDCTRLATPGYLRQREHRGGEAALDACVRGVFDRDRGLLDGPVRVGDVRMVKGGAVAIVTLQGDGYAGLTARLRLVPKWRLHRIEGFIEPQRSHLERLLRAELVAGEVPFRPGAAECAAARYEQLSDAALEARLLSPLPQAIYAPAVACAKPKAIEIAMRELPPGLSRAPRPLLRCARAKLRATPDLALIEILVDTDSAGAVDALVSCDREAVLAAYRAYLVGPTLGLERRQAGCIVSRLRSLPAKELVGALTDEGTGAAGAACA